MFTPRGHTRTTNCMNNKYPMSLMDDYSLSNCKVAEINRKLGDRRVTNKFSDTSVKGFLLRPSQMHP